MKVIAKLIGFYLNLLALVAPRLAAKKGFYVFCTPHPPAIEKHHQQYFDTSMKETFVGDQATIQTYRWGHGPKKILFVHGWQSHSYRWKKYIEAFPVDQYTLYAMDAPAHGASGGRYINIPLYGKAIATLIKKLGGVDVIVSHSFGSFSSLYILATEPTLSVGRLIIMGTPGEGNDFIQFYGKFLGLWKQTMKVILTYFEETLHHPPTYFSTTRFAGMITLPGLIIHDEGDEEAPYHYAVAIHHAWKNSRLLTTQGLGHNLKSTKTVKHVVEFVEDAQKHTPQEGVTKPEISLN